MGIIVPVRDFDSTVPGILKPIIYCGDHELLAAQAVAVNLPIAKKLVACDPKRRTLQIENIFKQVIVSLPGDDLVIKDFDILFNPEYKVDVLRILINTCKTKPFSVIWPGKYENKKLFYAEYGYPDFAVFDVGVYSVTCVVN